MSQKKVDRRGVIQSVSDKRLKQAETARQLGLSVRQIKRLVQQLRVDGVAGLVSCHRGRPSNNRNDALVRAEYLGRTQEHCPDFGPTLAHEKLAALHFDGIY